MFYFDKKIFKMKISGENNGIKGHIGFEIKEDNKMNYTLGLDYPIFSQKNLCVSGRLKNESIESMNPGLWLGISDQVNWFNSLEVKATYYPVKLTTESYFKSSLTELKLNLEKSRWSIWYETSLSPDHYDDQLGLKYKVNPGLGLSIIGNEEKMLFGIISSEGIND